MNLRQQIQMSDAELLQFLNDNRMLTCATNGADGWPHVVPLNYTVRDGPELWCWTYGSSQKARNLERDPRATVQVEAGVTYEELRGAMLKCAVTVQRGFDVVHRFGLELMSRSRGVAPEELDGVVQERARRQAAKRVVLQMKPLERATWDHRKIEDRSARG